MKNIIISILCAVLAAYLTIQITNTSHETKTITKETAYERVMRTSTLKCAYIVYPPETIKDPNTGALSGTIVDLTNEAGKQLGWKIEWVSEVGFADMFDGLASGKYDALCSGLWENPARAKAALFTIPINYGVYYAFVRADDTQFDQGLNPAREKYVKIAVIDGEYGDFVAKESFPDTQTYRLPQLSDVSQLLLSVTTHKADIAFLQKGPAKGYMAHNPGTLKILERYPVRVMPAPAIAVAPQEQALKNTLDATFRFLLNNGTVEGILRKYDPNLDSYKLIAKPYE